MENMRMILGNRYYSMDSYKTQLNNNVLVVGASGSGKTRGIVIPNILQAVGSYIIADPKGNLYNKYGDYLKNKGYTVRKLDFTDPSASDRYNIFKYIRNNQDIVKVANMLIYQSKDKSGRLSDPFWDQAAQLLLQALIAYMMEDVTEEERNLHVLNSLLGLFTNLSDPDIENNAMDLLMEDLEKKDPDSYAVSTYKKFRVAADRTLKSIIISANAAVGLFDTPDITDMLSEDDIDIPSIGQRKTALFVIVSDTDRSMDPLCNIFFTQAMNELCRYADKECKNCVLPVPVRFIMDDFATNCKINEFPRMISSIRSRGISTMLMIQSESQLKEGYNNDDRTIIGNCDTYVYLGGNDLETAKSVAERCDVPLKKILNMPIGTSWIFRRGHEPIQGELYRTEDFMRRNRNTEGEQNIAI